MPWHQNLLEETSSNKLIGNPVRHPLTCRKSDKRDLPFLVEMLMRVTVTTSSYEVTLIEEDRPLRCTDEPTSSRRYRYHGSVPPHTLGGKDAPVQTT